MGLVSQEPKNGFTGYVIKEPSYKDFDFSSIYRSKQFEEATKYFDNTDDMTRRILLAVNEADQNSVMTSLSNKLYQHIIDKVDDIDFGTIPLSEGDITKIENYDQLVDCTNVITDILQHYNQSVESTIGIVTTAMQNVIDRTELFTKAYKFKVEMPIVAYNTIVLSIVSSVSLMISSCIEFIKLPDDNGFDIALDKAAVNKTSQNLLFKDLAKFNSMCAKGEFDKAMGYVMQGNAKNFSGFGIAFGASSAVLLIGAVLMIIPVIRELIFLFYYARASVSDYFDAQATLLEMNAYNIENSLTRDPKTKKEIANKQRKVAEKFKKVSNVIKVDARVAEQKAEKEVKTLDSKKYKADEVLDTVPDSANSVLF